jgi:hypothetical protein
MAHLHKARGQRKEYVKRFEQRYGMSRAEWRVLKQSDPQKAHEIRTKLQATK